MTQEQIAEIEGLVAKATPGPWEVDNTDNGEAGSERFNYYSIGAGTDRWQTVVDTAGTDVACIEEEWDGDENGPWVHRWDEQGRTNCELIVALVNAAPSLILAAKERDRLKAENERLMAAINTPEIDDFIAGVPLEAAHQRERWGSEHDVGKTAFDWFWLIGYLSQKAASSAVAGDTEKAKHHTISTAAALANWHAALSGGSTEMRPGIDSRALEGTTHD